MTLYDILADLEDNDDLHLGRLLILMRAFAGKDGARTIDGLTKLAKLDFLLRYPVFLERALQSRPNAKPEAAEVKDHERYSVESSMVRYKYGPWDFRYRRFLNLLIAQRLAYVVSEGRTIKIGLTPVGINTANVLAKAPANQDLTKRAKLLDQHFNLSAITLMKFIYETFPEIVTLRLGEEIRHED
jgi:hypothetical protein